MLSLIRILNIFRFLKQSLTNLSIRISIKISRTNPDPPIFHLISLGIQFRIILLNIFKSTIYPLLIHKYGISYLHCGLKLSYFLPVLKVLNYYFLNLFAYSIKISCFYGWVANEFKGRKYDFLNWPLLIGDAWICLGSVTGLPSSPLWSTFIHIYAL